MNMTPEQRDEWLDAAQALLDGEPIEFLCSNGVWDDTTSVTNNYPHRRKPAPDPLAAVKAAHAAGRKVEYRSSWENAWKPLGVSPQWSQPASDYRIAPWTLPAPPAGQQWHRTDWTEDMLIGGWRPLLRHERPQDGDEFLFHPTIWTVQDRSKRHGDFPASPSMVPHRTRRPLPTPPRMVPLTRGDVPFGSVFLAPNGDVFVPVRFGDGGVYFMLDDGRAPHSWGELVAYGWKILRPGESEFSKCEKEETKP